jgi:hypothetical protein
MFGPYVTEDNADSQRVIMCCSKGEGAFVTVSGGRWGLHCLSGDES